MPAGALSPRHRLLFFAGAALLLPLIVAVSLLLANTFREAEARVQREAIATAHDLLERVRVRVDTDVSTLAQLAADGSIATGDWAAARAKAENLVSLNAAWTRLTLMNAETGAVLFAVGAPGGSVTPPPGPVPRGGRVDGIAMDAAGVPFVRMHARAGTEGRLVLSLDLDPRIFARILSPASPKSGVAAVVDRDGRFVWRSLYYEQRLGGLASSSLRGALRTGESEGIYRGRTLEGLDSFTAFVTSASTGWSAHVAVESGRLEGPRAGLRWSTLVGSVLALVLAGALVAVAVLDLTARQREQQMVLAMQRTEAVGQFTSSVVHDFRNLLAVMQASLNLIQRHTKEAETAARAEAARDALDRGERLCNQLLSFARRDGVEVTAVDLKSALENLSDILRKTLGPGVALEIDVPEAARWVMANDDQLDLAFVNLARNARDAMEGEGRFSIAAARAGEDVVTIAVRDTGPGIAPALREKLFEPFVTTKARGAGTGLGLAQVAGAASHAGGSVSAATAPGGGALFTLKLRAAAPPGQS